MESKREKEKNEKRELTKVDHQEMEAQSRHEVAIGQDTSSAGLSMEDGTIHDEATETEDVKPLVGYKQFLLFFVLFFGASFIFGVGVGLYGATQQIPLDDLWIMGYAIFIIDFILFFTALLAYKRVRTFVLSMLNLSALKSARTYGYLLAGAFIFFISQYLFLEILKVDDASEQASNIGFDQVTGFDWNYALFFVTVMLLTPIKEELLFRGLLHRFLEERHHFLIGLIVSSVIFGLVHPGYPFSAIVMGMVFVGLYKLTNSLSAPILLHILWNTYVVILISIEMA